MQNKIHKHYFAIALDLKKEWFYNARKGNLENMKYIYKIMKEKGIEEDMKEWRSNIDFTMSDETILMTATRFGSQNVLKWLLQELKFDVNEQNCDGDTALHYAANYYQVECARLLLDLGSQHLKIRPDNNPLDWANECPRGIWK